MAADEEGSRAVTRPAEAKASVREVNPRTWLSSVISVFCSSFSIAPCPLLHLCDSKPGLRSSYFLPPCFLHYATARDDLRRRSLEFPRNRDGSSLGLADDERVESLRICLASKKLQEKRSFLLWHFARKREKARGERGRNHRLYRRRRVLTALAEMTKMPRRGGAQAQPNDRRARGTGPATCTHRTRAGSGPGAPRDSLCALEFGFGHFLGFPGPPRRSNREPDRLRGPSLVRCMHGCTHHHFFHFATNTSHTAFLFVREKWLVATKKGDV